VSRPCELTLPWRSSGNYAGCIQEIAIVYRTKGCSRAGRAAPRTTSSVTGHAQTRVFGSEPRDGRLRS